MLDGHSSNVSIGRAATGTLYVQLVENAEPVQIENLDDVVLGCQILIFSSFFTFIKPSTIKKILRNEDGSLELTTETSTYFLEEFNKEA